MSKNVVHHTLLLIRPSCIFFKTCKVPGTDLDLEFMLFQPATKWVKEKYLFFPKGMIDLEHAQIFLEN